MSTVNLLSTTTDGQTVFLATPSGTPILTSETGGVTASSDLVFAKFPGNKTIVVQPDETGTNTNIEYTIIEDPNATAHHHGKNVSHYFKMLIQFVLCRRSEQF